MKVKLLVQLTKLFILHGNSLEITLALMFIISKITRKEKPGRLKRILYLLPGPRIL